MNDKFNNIAKIAIIFSALNNTGCTSVIDKNNHAYNIDTLTTEPTSEDYISIEHNFYIQTSDSCITNDYSLYVEISQSESIFLNGEEIREYPKKVTFEDDLDGQSATMDFVTHSNEYLRIFIQNIPEDSLDFYYQFTFTANDKTFDIAQKYIDHYSNKNNVPPEYINADHDSVLEMLQKNLHKRYRECSTTKENTKVQNNIIDAPTDDHSMILQTKTNVEFEINSQCHNNSLSIDYKIYESEIYKENDKFFYYGEKKIIADETFSGNNALFNLAFTNEFATKRISSDKKIDTYTMRYNKTNVIQIGYDIHGHHQKYPKNSEILYDMVGTDIKKCSNPAP